MSPGRRKTPEPQWQPPSDAALGVLRRQIEGGIADGETIKGQPHDASWGPWQSNLGDLIDRACGPGSAQASSFNWAGGIIADGPDGLDFSSTAHRAAVVEWRNEKIDKYSAAARGALKAIDQELERRGAQPVATGLVRRDFAFMRDEPLRAIAARDYNELRLQGPDVVKGRALLAGSVIEAVLLDALTPKGFTAKQVEGMSFFELIDEAAAASVIQARTMKAAHSVRDLRNFVHPAVELREGRLRKVDADQAVALMNTVLEDVAP